MRLGKLPSNAKRSCVFIRESYWLFYRQLEKMSDIGTTFTVHNDAISSKKKQNVMTRNVLSRYSAVKVLVFVNISYYIVLDLQVLCCTK